MVEPLSAKQIGGKIPTGLQERFLFCQVLSPDSLEECAHGI